MIKGHINGRYLAELRMNLISEVDTDVIVNIEF